MQAFRPRDCVILTMALDSPSPRVTELNATIEWDVGIGEGGNDVWIW
jgi:hypothetical protein